MLAAVEHVERQAGENSSRQLISSCFTHPKAAEKPEDDAKDKPEKQPANPEVAEVVIVKAEVHKADTKDYPLDEGATGGVDEEEDGEGDEDEDEDNEEWDVIQDQVEA